MPGGVVPYNIPPDIEALMRVTEEWRNVETKQKTGTRMNKEETGTDEINKNPKKVPKRKVMKKFDEGAVVKKKIKTMNKCTQADNEIVIQQMQNKIDALTENNMNLKKDIGVLKTENVDLKKENIDIKNENVEVKAKYARVRADNVRLTKDTEKLKRNAKQDHEYIKILTIEKGNLQKTNQDKEKQIQDLRKSRDEEDDS